MLREDFKCKIIQETFSLYIYSVSFVTAMVQRGMSALKREQWEGGPNRASTAPDLLPQAE